MNSYALPKEGVLHLGRHDPAEEKTRLWWSGSGIRFTLKAALLEADITWTGGGLCPWMGVVIDGAPVCRFPLMPGTRRYPLLAGMDGAVSHEVSLIRDSQPVEGSDGGPIEIEALTTDGEIGPSSPRPLLIEFLGDSLTVGEGCLGPRSANEWRTVWISVLGAFPALVSEAMHADMRVTALGGWGASRSWDNREENRIGRIYSRLCAPIPGGGIPADFPERQADAVVINLGTNDGGPITRMEGDQRTAGEETLCRRAVELMREVRARNPGAVILWAYGMCGKPMEPILKRAVDEFLAAGGERAAYLSLTPAPDQGSRSHPGPIAHRTAAREITDKLKEMLAE